MKKILIVTFMLISLSACSTRKLIVKNPDFEQSPCACMELPFPLQEACNQKFKDQNIFVALNLDLTSNKENI